MSLREWKFTIESAPKSEGVRAFLRQASERVDDYYESSMRARTPKFVPSEFYIMNDVLATLRRDKRCRGRRFLEWGCGFGVVAGLAAHYGFEASGIEWEPVLAQAAKNLMRDFDLPVTIGCGDMIPSWLCSVQNDASDTCELHQERPEPDRVQPEDVGPAYEQINLIPEDVDVFFVYPWPDEIEMVQSLFDRVADDGALLIQFQGIDEVHIFQRV